MTEEYIIKKLRAAIPEMKCKITCSDCCGPVFFTQWEWEQVKNKKKATSLHCPYETPAGCEIYKDRPIMCRLFGQIDTKIMLCPHGYKPDRLLSEKKGAQIRRILIRFFWT